MSSDGELTNGIARRSLLNYQYPIYDTDGSIQRWNANHTRNNLTLLKPDPFTSEIAGNLEGAISKSKV